jgi:hypothetical protein
MAETLKHLKELKLHHPDLSELQYFTRLRETQSASGLGFTQMSNGFTTVGVGLTFVCVLVVGFLSYYYCCRKSHPAQQPAAPLPPTVIFQPVPGYAQPPPSYSQLRQPAPRRSARLLTKSGFCCASGSRSDEEDAGVRYQVQEEEVELRPLHQRQQHARQPRSEEYPSAPPSHAELHTRLSTLSH